MIEYIKAQPRHMDDIVDFANMVFSLNHTPTNFRTLVPRLYGSGVDSSALHFLALENGKIKALVCSMIVDITVCDVPLKIAHIGTVSTHPYSRGKGYMTKLLTMAQDEMVENGVDFSLLNGNRLRYSHFGYEKSGLTTYVTIGKKLESPSFPIELCPLDKCQLSQLYPIYAKNPIICRNLEDFHLAATMWECDVYGVKQDGEYRGYICANRDDVREISLENPQLLRSCVLELCKKTGVNSLSFPIPTHDTGLTREAIKIASRYSLSWQDNYKIFNFKAVLKAYTMLKLSFAPMDSFTHILKIGEETIEYSLKNGELSICDSTLSPTLIFETGAQAALCLFSPGAYTMGLPSPFPLPLYISSMDTI